VSSVDVRQKPNGKWEVRWRDGRRRGRTITRARDAQRFAERIRRELDLGGVVRLDHEVPTLAEYVETYWRAYAIPNLAQNTRSSYKQMWAKHIYPRLGDLRLHALTPGVINSRLVGPMRKAGCGDPTITKTLAMLQSVMSQAVLDHGDVVRTNPLALVRKPRQTRRDAEPIPPAIVESMRRRLGPRDATMVSVLAYAGLRPGELLALEWRDISADVIAVDRAVACGELRGDDRTKRHARDVRLLEPLARDLKEWRLAAGRPAGRQLVFPRADGTIWQDEDWRNWRKRVYRPAARAAGLTSLRPYDLRGSFVSLLIHEGYTVVDVADQAGHAAETCLRYYARLFRDAPPPSERVPAETAIAAARNAMQERLAI
jgi:Site-specific recombinase XerC